jgi:hypothetical protein
MIRPRPQIETTSSAIPMEVSTGWTYMEST